MISNRNIKHKYKTQIQNTGVGLRLEYERERGVAHTYMAIKKKRVAWVSFSVQTSGRWLAVYL